jgi:MFS family permease
MRWLIGGRALQGIAGGGCIQLSTVTISDLFGLRKRSLLLGCMEGMWFVFLAQKGVLSFVDVDIGQLLQALGPFLVEFFLRS